MPFLPDPPQGATGQELTIIGRPPIPRFSPTQGLPAPSLLLLDNFPGAQVAYSLRKLRSSYNGPAIRVRNTIIQSETDIGFLSDGNLDIQALLDFNALGFGNTDVVTWYDQSGNGIDLIQNTQDEAPLIVVSGVVQKSNNAVAMVFDGIDDDMVSSLSLPTPASHLFIFTVTAKDVLSNNADLFNFNFPDAINHVFVRISNANMIIWDAGPAASNRLTSPLGFNDTFQHIYGFSKTAGTDNQKILEEGTEIAQRTQGSTSTVLDQISVATNAGGAPFANIRMQELIFYDSNELTNFTAISDAMEGYWKNVQITTELGEVITTELGAPLVTEG